MARARRRRRKNPIMNPLVISNPLVLAHNPLDTSDYPKTYTALGAGLGSLVGGLPGALVAPRNTAVGGVIALIGSVAGGAAGGYLFAPPDRKSRGAIGGAIGGLFSPIGAAIGGAIGGRKADAA